MKDNNTEHEYPRYKTIHSYFDDMVAAVPDNIAVEFEDDYVTYGELNDSVSRIAAYLLQNSVCDGDIVAFICKRSINMIAAILAVLKIGAVYLPIDTEFPDERKRYCLMTAQAKTIISDYDLKQLYDLPNISLNKIPDDTLPEQFPLISSDHLAYVIFTSGSTGHPKGVMIRHYSVVNRLLWMKEQYNFNADDVFLQKTVCSFDVSVWELFLWFFCGAKLCLLRSGCEGNFSKLISTIERHHVTVCHFVPSILRVFLQYISHRCCSDKVMGLRKVFSSGEALSYELTQQFIHILTKPYNTQLHNLYGPTEATVDVTYFDCTNYLSDDHTVPIGCPIWNTKIYVLDSDRQECADGQIGEIYISGDGVALGYINNAVETEKSFLPDIYDPNQVMYRTGDLGRWHNHVVEYVGRVDNQIKIHGIRIEPEEIEKNIRQYNQITDAVVIAVGDANKKLVAFYCSKIQIDRSSLAIFLTDKLPKGMIPSEFIFINKIPVMHNGKVDRKAILQLYQFYR